MAPTDAPAPEPGAHQSADRTMRPGPVGGLRDTPAPVLLLGRRSTVKSLVEELPTDSSTPHPNDVALVARFGVRLPIVISVVTSQRAALNQVRVQPPRAILVEVDSRPRSRLRFCRMLRNRAPGVAILALGDKPNTGLFDFDGFVPLPLTVQRAEAAIERLQDGGMPQILACGPLRLDAAARTVETPNGTRYLTPKLAALLEHFMLHCNEVVPRSDIMAAIWQTSYLDDTRTLDVHVRWLRESIEPEPSNPRYLITARGVGYALKCG